MGSTPSGPSFTPGGAPPQWRESLGPAPLSPPDPAAYRPPRSRVPALVTTAAFALVALVVLVASLVAHRADQQPVAPPSRSALPPRITTATDSIEFTTRTGSGRLTIVGHTWRPGRTDPTSVLEVGVRIECTSGSVDYDPFAFQAFDGAGNLFDLAAEEIRGPMLGVGVLSAGETTTGQVAFVIPRGEVTLLMSDDASSVTALKIPD